MPVQDDLSIAAKDITDLDMFKARVVRVGMAAAEDHGWCSVVQDLLVDDLGLQEYFPPKLAVQRQDAPGYDWYSYLTYDGSQEEVATREAVRLWSWTKDTNSRPVSPFNHPIRVDRDTDLDAVLKDLKERQAMIGEMPGVEDMYPRYRIQQVSPGSTGEPIGEPIWDCLTFEKERAAETVSS